MDKQFIYSFTTVSLIDQDEEIIMNKQALNCSMAIVATLAISVIATSMAAPPPPPRSNCVKNQINLT
jgi:hypothetical protein